MAMKDAKAISMGGKITNRGSETRPQIRGSWVHEYQSSSKP